MFEVFLHVFLKILRIKTVARTIPICLIALTTQLFQVQRHIFVYCSAC